MTTADIDVPVERYRCVVIGIKDHLRLLVLQQGCWMVISVCLILCIICEAGICQKPSPIKLNLPLCYCNTYFMPGRHIKQAFHA